MPVSKKRKPKNNKRTTPPQKAVTTTSGSAAAAGKKDDSKKKKLSKQQIAIYVISAVMILSLAVGYLVGNSRSGGRGAPAPTTAPTVATSGETPVPTQAAPPTAESSEGK